MRTFSELLREYTARTGVSDAELARAVGVQRQTIFRWKEGLVARPRSADDALRLAAKLRLTPAERDELLLAAGFPPVDERLVPPIPHDPPPTPPDETAPLPQARGADDSPGGTEGEAPAHVALAPERAASLRRAVVITWAAMLLLAAFALYVALSRPSYPQAAAGETLVLVAEFGNYTGGAQGYNVAGRLGEALERELAAAGLSDTRVARWPDAVGDEQAAKGALARSQAALLVWGEYDSGRVVARFLQREEPGPASVKLSLLAATPAELPAVINSAVPGDIRYLALYSLAQVYLHSGKIAGARAALGQAGLNLPDEPETRAAHHFLRGYANQVDEPQDLDLAIEAYTQALEVDATLDLARSNRAIAYLKRQEPGDLEGAVDDLTRYLETQPDDPAALNNRGSAYFLLRGAENTRLALKDFSRAVELAPGDLTGYYNRGLALIRIDEDAGWRADLGRARDGGHPGAGVALCWGYALSDEPAAAVEVCREAAESGDAGSWENLGVALARSGRLAEATVALESFRATAQGAVKAAEVDEWIAAIAAARNPFDAETLRRLREE